MNCFEVGVDRRLEWFLLPLNQNVKERVVENHRLSGDEPSIDEPGVVVVSAPQYFRFRGVLKRLEGTRDKWLRNSLIVALGGFATKTR